MLGFGAYQFYNSFYKSHNSYEKWQEAKERKDTANGNFYLKSMLQEISLGLSAFLITHRINYSKQFGN